MFQMIVVKIVTKVLMRTKNNKFDFLLNICYNPSVLIYLGVVLMFIKRIISQTFYFLLVTVFFSGVAFANNITIKLDTIGGNRKQLSLWQVGMPAKNGKRIFAEQFDADNESDFLKINGKKIKDHRVVKVISKLINRFILVSKKLDLLLIYGESPDVDMSLLEDDDNIDTLSDEKDFLFEKLIKLLMRNAR